jgi:hypothetical protein
MLSTRRSIGRGGLIVFATLVISVMLAACGGAASILSTVGSSVGGAPQPAATAAAAGGSDGQGNGSTTGGNLFAPGPNLLIIKTGTLVLQVGGIDAALATASQRITALGGYASGSDRSGDGDSDQATVTFRIPAARWDEALTALRGVATKVLGERSTTEDVTGQVVDLEARITNLRATEKALQAIMDRATDIKDVLAVQSELTTVRGQIEEMTAQSSHLQEQAAYSTLSVTLSIKPDPVLTSGKFDPTNEVDQASASLVRVLQGLATAGIWFLIVWLPILIALAIVVSIGLFIARRVRRSMAASAAPAEPSA